MKTILFIQGGGNGGYEADKKLVASLKNALEKKYEIAYPEIQLKETESDYGWTKQIGEKISENDKNLILVGHSFGASMILKFLSENPVQTELKGIFLIATPYWNGNDDWIQGLMLKDNFADKLPDNVPMFFYHCKDDEEIPFSQLQDYKEKLNRAVYREIEKGGHQLNNDLTIVAKDIESL